MNQFVKIPIPQGTSFDNTPVNQGIKPETAIFIAKVAGAFDNECYITSEACDDLTIIRQKTTALIEKRLGCKLGTTLSTMNRHNVLRMWVADNKGYVVFNSADNIKKHIRDSIAIWESNKQQRAKRMHENVVTFKHMFAIFYGDIVVGILCYEMHTNKNTGYWHIEPNACGLESCERIHHIKLELPKNVTKHRFELNGFNTVSIFRGAVEPFVTTFIPND